MDGFLKWEGHIHISIAYFLRKPISWLATIETMTVQSNKPLTACLLYPIRLCSLMHFVSAPKTQLSCKFASHSRQSQTEYNARISFMFLLLLRLCGILQVFFLLLPRYFPHFTCDDNPSEIQT